MLIKWRQEMGSVGLLVLMFQSAPLVPYPPTPTPTLTLSVLLTYIDHKPPRPDISAASGNHHPSSRCNDVTDSERKGSKPLGLQVYKKCIWMYLLDKIYISLANNSIQINAGSILQEGFNIFALVPFHPRGSGSEHKTGQSLD